MLLVLMKVALLVGGIVASAALVDRLSGDDGWYWEPHRRAKRLRLRRLRNLMALHMANGMSSGIAKECAEEELRAESQAAAAAWREVHKQASAEAGR